MVKIRLQRVGAKSRPSYRVVVMDSRLPRDGAYIERIGHYDPLTDPETVHIDKDQALRWLRQGAQPSQAVARLLSKLGITPQPQEAKSAQATQV
jgi:small subunit ribosomal protein S16